MGTHLSLNEQNCWLMTCQTISSDDMVKEGVVRKFVSRRKYPEGRAAREHTKGERLIDQLSHIYPHCPASVREEQTVFFDSIAQIKFPCCLKIPRLIFGASPHFHLSTSNCTSHTTHLSFCPRLVLEVHNRLAESSVFLCHISALWDDLPSPPSCLALK
jgi:hypothetical protein